MSKHRAQQHDYHPTVEDFTPRNPQQLSCREAGQFDHKQEARTTLTGWGRICKERAGKGRKHRRAT